MPVEAKLQINIGLGRAEAIPESLHDYLSSAPTNQVSYSIKALLYLLNFRDSAKVNEYAALLTSDYGLDPELVTYVFGC